MLVTVGNDRSTAPSPPVTAQQLTRRFGKATKSRTARVTELLDTLVALGTARHLPPDRYTITT